MQLIRQFLSIPLCLLAVDLQIIAYSESQTLQSVLLSGQEGSCLLMEFRLHLSSVRGNISLGNAFCHCASLWVRR